jgi:hypothetical protein
VSRTVQRQNLGGDKLELLVGYHMVLDLRGRQTASNPPKQSDSPFWGTPKQSMSTSRAIAGRREDFVHSCRQFTSDCEAWLCIVWRCRFLQPMMPR